MGLANVRPFFRERLEGLGYTEHDQPFEPTEIGANIVDGAFHMETGTISSGPANQRSRTFEYPLTIRVYKAGYSDILEAVDAALEEADTILNDLLQPSVRLGNAVGIKDIVPNSVQPTALDATNDNVVVIVMVLTARLELCF